MSPLDTPQASLVKLEIVAALLAFAVLAGAAAGWLVNGWRLGSQIERLQGKVALEQGANGRCERAVTEVQTTMNALREDEKARGVEVQKAVAKAAADSKTHLEAAREALNRAAPQPGSECDTAARESRAYVEKRRASP
jgi:hypothetical protein